jgi:hypothetical protein
VGSDPNPLPVPRQYSKNTSSRRRKHDAGLNSNGRYSPLFFGVPNLDFFGTLLTRKQHFLSAAERLWNAFGTHKRSILGMADGPSAIVASGRVDAWLLLPATASLPHIKCYRGEYL